MIIHRHSVGNLKIRPKSSKIRPKSDHKISKIQTKIRPNFSKNQTVTDFFFVKSRPKLDQNDTVNSDKMTDVHNRRTALNLTNSIDILLQSSLMNE